MDYVVAPSKSDFSAINSSAATSIRDAKEVAHYKSATKPLFASTAEAWFFAISWKKDPIMSRVEDTTP